MHRDEHGNLEGSLTTANLFTSYRILDHFLPQKHVYHCCALASLHPVVANLRLAIHR